MNLLLVPQNPSDTAREAFAFCSPQDSSQSALKDERTSQARRFRANEKRGAVAAWPLDGSRGMLGLLPAYAENCWIIREAAKADPRKDQVILENPQAVEALDRILLET